MENRPRDQALDAVSGLALKSSSGRGSSKEGPTRGKEGYHVLELLAVLEVIDAGQLIDYPGEGWLRRTVVDPFSV